MKALARERGTIERVVALDVSPLPARLAAPHVRFEELDVRSARLAEVLKEYEIDTVVDLACIVTPFRGMTRNMHYAIDVDGTHNVLNSCIETGVQQLVIASSGAAYGFHADNPNLIEESYPLRGNDELPYSRHKRLVEELLARYRKSNPELMQLVFRPAVVLGATVRSAAAAMFERPMLWSVAGDEARFGFIWDEDVVACLLKGVFERRSGIYNLAADGSLTLREIAGITGARCIPVPASLLRGALSVLRRLRVTRAGPEQVTFLRYRPVLANAALKSDFGFTPTKTSREAFEAYWASHRRAAAELLTASARQAT